jgi:TonB-dependent SusC/RagA subfamily outer membrane receptor
MLCTQLLAQTRTITGRLSDAAGAPLANASIIVKGTTIGTTSKPDGTFSLAVPASAKVLIISSVAMATEQVTIGDKNEINLSLKSEDKTLSEVVVVGYQSVKRSEVAGAVSSVKGTEIAQKPIGNFTQLLQGKATGVQVTGQSGRAGAGGYIRIRGTGSINASNEPLIILDGVPISTVSYNLLNPNDVDEITVLKDAASAAIYGSRAANGVLVITTKKGRTKPELRYSFQYGRSKAMDLKNLTLMNSRQKMQYEYEGNKVNPILDTMITNRIASGGLPAGSTLFNINAAQREDLWNLAESRGAGNWADYLLQEAKTVTHEIGISGSSNKFKYYFSLNKSDNEGVSYGAYWNRIGGRLNVEFSPVDWFKIGTNVGIAYSKEAM